MDEESNNTQYEAQQQLELSINENPKEEENSEESIPICIGHCQICNECDS